MRTVGKKIPANMPSDDTVFMCDYCGAHNYRSKMRKDAAGLWVCPRHGKGRDAVTLAEEAAAAAAEGENSNDPGEGGHYIKP